MEVIGTYQRGFTPEENIDCKIKIDKYGIEIYPIDASLYNEVSRPKDRLEYNFRKFIGDKRFSYTWTIEYKDEKEKYKEIHLKISDWTSFRLKRIKGMLLYQKFTKYEYLTGAAIAFLLNIAASFAYGTLTKGCSQTDKDNTHIIINKNTIDKNTVVPSCGENNQSTIENKILRNNLPINDSLNTDTTINL